MPFWKTDLPSLPKKEKPQKIPKPIPKISEKKKKRIKEEGSETALFLEIWGERSHSCEICGKQIQEPKPWCFSHILSKGRYPALRYNKNNILLCCGEECHHENDRRNKGRDAELIKLILS